MEANNFNFEAHIPIQIHSVVHDRHIFDSDNTLNKMEFSPLFHLRSLFCHHSRKMHQILGMKRSASVKAGSRAASQRMGRQRGMNVSVYIIYTSSFALI